MAGYEYAIIIGNVGRDPELRYLQSGTAVCNFSVAVTTRWKDRQSGEQREKTKWFRVTAWRGLAETCNTYVHKGMPIMVTGEVEASAYTNSSGEPTATLELTARDVQFLGRRGEGTEGGSSGGQQSGSSDYDDFSPPPKDPDDIPF